MIVYPRLKYFWLFSTRLCMCGLRGEECYRRNKCRKHPALTVYRMLKPVESSGRTYRANTSNAAFHN